MENNANRIIWATTRSILESSREKNMRNGVKRTERWSLFEKLLNIFVVLLKITKLYDLGYKNALNIKIKSHQLQFNNLPKKFDGYRILHLTDLHIDITNDVESALIKTIENLEYDICLITGDYRFATYGSFSAILKPMQRIVDKINAKDGIYATLGNHDTFRMSDEFEKMGITMLNNESCIVKKGDEEIILSGTDDVHYYYTDAALYCLEKPSEGFKIALVHSPELYDIAVENNYNLYLCGHTHGGQICLPGKIPLVTHLHNGKKLKKGLWKVKQMYGYTSEGCGTSGIPIRFFSESEVTIFTLNKEMN